MPDTTLCLENMSNIFFSYEVYWLVISKLTVLLFETELAQ